MSDANTPSEPASGQSIAEQKVAAEVLKLSLEARKMESELAGLNASRRLELYKTIAGFATAIVAIAGLLLTLRAQQITKDLESEKASDQALQTALSLYGVQAVNSRLAAIGSFETLLSDRYPNQQRLASQMLVTALVTDEDPTVRSLARTAVIRNASAYAVALLSEQNRLLQADLARAEKIAPAKLRGFERNEHAAQVTHAIADAIEENGKTIVDALNAIFAREGVVRDVDVSGVAFMMPRISAAADDESFGWTPRPDIAFARGIVFVNAKMVGAKLSWLSFEDCKFTNASLDGAKLVGAFFKNCRFDGRTSLADFVWHFDGPDRFGVGPEYQFAKGPMFVDSRIEAETFHPVDADVDSFGKLEAFGLSQTVWNVRKVPEDVLARLVLRGESPPQEHSWTPTGSVRGIFFAIARHHRQRAQ